MPTIRSIVLASKNPGKLREMREILHDLPVQVLSLEEFPHIEEPSEDGETFADNARDKALYYARKTGLWCLADDSGLVVDALGGQPGVYSARYAADECLDGAGREIIDAANNAKLLRCLKDVSDEKRTARFVCHLALAGDGRVILETRGTIEGRIGHAPRGKNGFGYDPLFYLPDRPCTTAELSSEEKNRISHRGQAARQLAENLREFLGHTA